MFIEVVLEEKKLTFENDGVEIKKVINDMLEFTKSLQVDNDETFKIATSLYRQARDWKKIIDEKRKTSIEPDRKRIALINDKAKELCDPLDHIVEITNKLTANYNRLLETKKKEEEERIKQATQIFGLTTEIYVAPLETTIRGQGAISITKEVKKFNLVDLSKVPLKYLMLDETKIKLDLKLGVNEIPGLEIYEEKITQLRSR